MKVVKNRDRHDGERFAFFAGIDDGQTRPGQREHDRCGPRPGDRHVHVNAAGRRVAPQLLADRSRRANQTVEAADVDRHEVVAMALVARSAGDFHGIDQEIPIIGQCAHQRVRRLA